METSLDYTYTIWLKYVAMCVAIKYDFEIIDWSKEQFGWGTPKSLIGKLEFRQLWLSFHIKDYKEFMSAEHYGFNHFTKIW